MKNKDYNILMPPTIKTLQGIAILSACLLLAVIFITQAAKQFDVANTVLSTIQPRTQVAAVADFDSNLVAHYTFDDTTNDSAGTNNGTISGGATYVDGKVGRAVSFNGSNHMTLTSSTLLNNLEEQGGGGMTISVWIYPNDTSHSQYIVTKNGQSSGSWALSLSAYDNQVIVRFVKDFADQDLDVFTRYGAVVAGKWQHIVLTWDGSADADKVLIYVDGVDKTYHRTSGIGAKNSDVNNDFFIGSYLYGGSLNGNIDDLRVYKKVLSQSEITELFNYVGDVTTLPSTTPPTSSVNGQCGTAVNLCTAGTLSDTTDSTTEYLWSCVGANNGSTASCSLPKTEEPPIESNNVTAASCNLSDVESAINRVKNGGTVNIPAGNCSWNRSLAITKGVNLIGAGTPGGERSTIISNSIPKYTDSHGNVYSYPLISYSPANYAANDPFRVSGFSFDLNNNGKGITLGESGKSAPFTIQTNVRIDHNTFYNGGDTNYQAIYSHDTMDGVVDNNTFNGVWYPFRVDTGNNVPSIEAGYFANFYPTWALGSEKTLYFEDNIISDLRAGLNGEANEATLIDCQFAAKGYVMRYNTISLYKDSYNLMDIHGAWNPSMFGCFGAEIYGNKITALHTGYPEREGAIRFAAMRSGKSMLFYNTGIGAGNYFGFHYYNNLGGPSISCASAYTKEQMIHDSYSWNNRENYNGALGSVSVDSGTLMTCNGLENVPSKNREWFTDSGTDPYISSGSALPNVCTVGNAYWLTNQSVSDLTGMVGAHPATPIFGTLYKCTSSNVWTSYYTPYTYPHPLRGEMPATPQVVVPPPNIPNVINARSVEYTDVKSAYDSAKDGDTVQIPVGIATWTSTLTVGKSIILKGAGGNGTKIIHTGLNPVINISLTDDVPVRVTGLYFDLLETNAGNRYAINVAGGNRSNKPNKGFTKIRIDNNIFNKGQDQIFWTGWAYGVIDHNRFINGHVSIRLIGDDNNAWNRPILPGSADSVFIEDNIFITDQDYGNGKVDQFIYHQQGARSTTRHNTFDTRSYLGDYPVFDSHGNWGYPDIMDYRGQPIIEVYDNTFQAYKTYIFFDFRGGSVLAHDNTFTTKLGFRQDLVFKLVEEEAWTSGGPWCPSHCPIDTVYPAQDQINNSFFWNNTLNGSPITSISLDSLVTEPEFIKKDRDYFMHAPCDGTGSCTGGKTLYTGPQGGNLSFTSAGPNAYYPYTPYVYPHPLVSGIINPSPSGGTPPSNSTPGDFNSDGSVNAVDFSALSSHWNRSDTLSKPYDLNHDGIVNSLDFSIMATHWTG